MKPLLSISSVLRLAGASGLLLTAACNRPAVKQAASATPLTAVIRGDLALLKTMEAAGTDLDAQYPSRFNWTALMAAIYFQRSEMITNLLDHNVDVRKRDATGNTALMWAIELEDTNTVALLVSKALQTLRENENWQQVAAEIQADPHPERWHVLLDQFLKDAGKPERNWK